MKYGGYFICTHKEAKTIETLLKMVKKESLIDDTVCLQCGEGKPGYCEDCVQKMVNLVTELQLTNQIYKSQLETANSIVDNINKELKERIEEQKKGE